MLRRHAYPAIGDTSLCTIRPSKVQAWVKSLSLVLAPSTVAVVHGLVAAVFKAGIRDRKLAGSPCDGTRLPKPEPREVTPLGLEVVGALTNALPPRYRTLVTLGAGTGLRQGE